jgi:hypothetical protein
MNNWRVIVKRVMDLLILQVGVILAEKRDCQNLRKNSSLAKKK